jgi:hypothetical protein
LPSFKINRENRPTGNAIILMADEMMRKKHQLSFDEFNHISELFIEEHSIPIHPLDFQKDHRHQTPPTSNVLHFPVFSKAASIPSKRPKSFMSKI